MNGTHAQPTTPAPGSGFQALDEHGRSFDVRLPEPTLAQAKEFRVRLNERDHRFEPLARISRTDLLRLSGQARRAWESQRLASHYWRWRCCLAVLNHRAVNVAKRTARKGVA